MTADATDKGIAVTGPRREPVTSKPAVVRSPANRESTANKAPAITPTKGMDFSAILPIVVWRIFFATFSMAAFEAVTIFFVFPGVLGGVFPGVFGGVFPGFGNFFLKSGSSRPICSRRLLSAVSSFSLLPDRFCRTLFSWFCFCVLLVLSASFDNVTSAPIAFAII